jgi:hypothetical protein
LSSSAPDAIIRPSFPVTKDDMAGRVAWPAVLKYAAEDGLVIVDSLSEWNLDPDMYARPYAAGDRLIDSVGVEYRLGFSEGPGIAHARVEPTGRTLAAGELLAVARLHLKAIGAPEEWLGAHLEGIPESQQIRYALQYLARLGDAAGDDSDAEDGE